MDSGADKPFCSARVNWNRRLSHGCEDTAGIIGCFGERCVAVDGGYSKEVYLWVVGREEYSKGILDRYHQQVYKNGQNKTKNWGYVRITALRSAEEPGSLSLVTCCYFVDHQVVMSFDAYV